MTRTIGTFLGALLVGTTLAGPSQADPLIIDETALDAERLAAGIYPAAPGSASENLPSEPLNPPLELDWSIALRGSYTASTSGSSFVTTLRPALTATHQGVRTVLIFDAGADLARSDSGNMGLVGVDLALETSTMLDRDTSISGNTSFVLSQELPGQPGGNPSVTTPPQVVTGSLGGRVDRQFGRFNLGVAGNLERTVYGPTNRTDTGVTDNSEQNVWQGDASLRLGLQVTPIFEVFGEGALGRDWFDQASAGATRPDATSRSLRAGISGTWNDRWIASASLGIGRHDFDDAALTDITTLLYDASLSYSPDPTLALTAALATTVTPTGSDIGGVARVAHAASADAAYTVNSWLRLRASANWGLSRLEGSSETETQYGLGAGADYKVNTHTAVSADYSYAHRDNSATGLHDSHKVSLGVTVKR